MIKDSTSVGASKTNKAMGDNEVAIVFTHTHLGRHLMP